MKIKAILKGNEINFSQFIVFKKPEIEVEVNLSDNDVQVLSEEDFNRLTLHALRLSL